MQQSAALPLLLQHTSLHSDVRAVLRLCCTSKAVRAAVLQHCEGVLCIQYQLSSLQQAQQLAHWLVQYGQLAGDLRCLVPDFTQIPYLDGLIEQARLDDLESAEKALAAALVQLQQKQRQQSLQQGGLQLKALFWQCVRSSSAVAGLLRVLPGEKLHHLALFQQEDAAEQEQQQQQQDNTAYITADSIAALRKLQSLAVREAMSVQQLHQALPGLTALTKLGLIASGSRQCSKQEFTALLQQLPAQLKELAVEVEIERDRTVQLPALQLLHLSCLTSLKTLAIEPRSQLPPQLQELSCSCRQLQPLLGCEQLQSITLYSSVSTADELSQLSQLTHLTYLSLGYAEHIHVGAADAAASAWPQLASSLRDLTIFGLDPGGLAAASIKQIKHLQSLTRLKIEVSDENEGDGAVALPLTAVQLADVLAGLTALQTLELGMDPGRHLLKRATELPEADTLVALAALHAYQDASAAVQQALGAAGLVALQQAQAIAGVAEAPGGQVQAAVGTAHSAMHTLLEQLQGIAAAPAAAAPALAPAAEPPAEAAPDHMAAAWLALGYAAPAAPAGAALPAAPFVTHLAALNIQLGNLISWLQQAVAPPAGQAAEQPQADMQVEQQQQQQAHELSQLYEAVQVQYLDIYEPLAQQLDLGEGSSPNMLPVTRVISRLPHLQSLELKGSGLDLKAVEPLTVLTQLTRLTMSGCNFNDAAFNLLAMNLTRLKRLSIGGSELVGDGGLVVAAHVLTQLTSLNIRSCSKVTDEGVLQLTRLQQLSAIFAEDTDVSKEVVSRVLRRGTN
jgi:Leucine-rich repeat (LRR) protein